MDKDGNTFFYINPDMEEPTDDAIDQERKAAFTKSTVKTLKEQHKVKRHDFFYNFEEYYRHGQQSLPDFARDYLHWVSDYIDVLEKKNEELEKGIKSPECKEIHVSCRSYL